MQLAAPWHNATRPEGQDLFSFVKDHLHSLFGWSLNEAEAKSKMDVLNETTLLSVTDSKGRIVYANDLFCSTSEYTLPELIHNSHNIVRHPEMPSEVFREMWRTIGRGRVWRGELKNRTKSGGAYWVNAIVAPVLGQGGKPERYVSIRYDITRQKQLEAELHEARNTSEQSLLDNIACARRIHETLLGNPGNNCISNDSFLLYKAQKHISGDFYKFQQRSNDWSLVLGDSTGHGISASYISIMALQVLSTAIDFCNGKPDRILQLVNNELNAVTRPDKLDSIMETADMMVCHIDQKKMLMEYASAGMRGVIIRNGEEIILERDKLTVGDLEPEIFRVTPHQVQLEQGDCLYLFTDGLIDQLGGPRGKRIGLKTIVSLLKKHHHMPMIQQKAVIVDCLEAWQGYNEQTDDLTLFGIKF